MTDIRKLTKTSGTSMIEFALLVVLLSVILMGTVDFARVFYAAVTVADASRAALQYGSQTNGLTGDNTGMRNASRLDAQNLSSTDVTVTPERFCRCEGSSSNVNCVTATCPEGAPQIYVRVRTRYDFHTLFNFPGIPSSVPLNVRAQARVQ